MTFEAENQHFCDKTAWKDCLEAALVGTNGELSWLTASQSIAAATTSTKLLSETRHEAGRLRPGPTQSLTAAEQDD